MVETNAGDMLNVERMVWHDMQIARNGLDLTDGAVRDREIRKAYELIQRGEILDDQAWQGVLPPTFQDWPDQSHLYIRDFVRMARKGVRAKLWRGWIGFSVWLQQVTDF